jgi:predicted dehydrogenase
MNGKLRMGMVGGGAGAFIGAIHRLAAEMTGDIELVAGAFSRDAAASRAFGEELGLDPDRSYGSFVELFAGEAARPEHERMQCVSIVTPNDSHAEITCAALEAGFHVICDKPAAGHLEDGLRMQAAVQGSGLLFALTHTYTGYPMVIEARERIAARTLGDIRRVHVTYLQDWLSRDEDTTGSKQASWRNDPSRSGEAGAFADIGTHAFNLVEFTTGRRVTRLAAQLRSVIAGRVIDDDGGALFELDNGAAGLLSASQVCSGAVNALRIEIYGSEASLHWFQEEPNRLVLKTRGAPEQVLQPGAGSPYLSDAAQAVCRTPAGHPEGYIEAFANLYAAFARDVRRFPEPPVEPRGYATIDDGVAALRFIRASVVSSREGAAWTALEGIEDE